MDPSNKVVAGTTAGTIASAIASLVIYYASLKGLDFPQNIQLAINALFTALCTGIAVYAAGYWKVERNPAPSAAATVHMRDAAR
jgi:predicted lysophospholipase L1 biosynthesis ABC-type transport system permease subunit